MSYCSATIGGIAGFGGGILVLPFITNLLGIKSAIPVLTISQVMNNSTRVWVGFKEVDWKSAWIFLITGLPASVLGSVLFAELPKDYIAKGIAVLICIILLLRRLTKKGYRMNPLWLLVGGGLSGFFSGVSGVGGPISAVFFLGLGLPPGSYVATEAVTATLIHFTKMVVYQQFELIKWETAGNGLFLGVGMMIGAWTGKKILDRLPRKVFLIIVETLLFISAVQLWFSE